MKTTPQLSAAALLAVIAFTFLLARADDQGAPPNLLPNPGFETWTEWTPPTNPNDPKPTVVEGRVPAGCQYEIEAYETKQDPKFPITVTFARDGDIKHGGDYSVKITNASFTDIGGIMSPQIAVYPNTTYRLKFWYRGDNIVPNPKPGDGLGVVFWFNEGGAPDYYSNLIINAHAPDRKTGTFEWEPFETTFTTAKTTAKLVVVAQLRRATGTVWFDDFSLTLVPPTDTSSGNTPAPDSSNASPTSSDNPTAGLNTNAAP